MLSIASDFPSGLADYNRPVFVLDLYPFLASVVIEVRKKVLRGDHRADFQVRMANTKPQGV